jgi:hypothetical protein
MKEQDKPCSPPGLIATFLILFYVDQIFKETEILGVEALSGASSFLGVALDSFVQESSFTGA